MYGLEKFWAFIKYYKGAGQLDIIPQLQEYLDKFKTIEDFRVLRPQLDEMVDGLNLTPNKRRPRSVSESEGNVVIGKRGHAGGATTGANTKNNRERVIPRCVGSQPLGKGNWLLMARGFILLFSPGVVPSVVGR